VGKKKKVSKKDLAMGARRQFILVPHVAQFDALLARFFGQPLRQTSGFIQFVAQLFEFGSGVLRTFANVCINTYVARI